MDPQFRMYTRDLFESHYPGQGYVAGDWSYGMPRVMSWGEGRTVRIGKFCSFGHDVAIFLGGGHRADWVTTYPFSALDPAAAHIPGHPHSRGDVTIGHDVWLAQECRILSGVTVGDGACIGAFAVVTRDVAPYTIVAGNPARPVRLRFSEAQVGALIEIRWWDWPIETIRAHYPLLLSQDIDAFIHAARALDGAETGAA